MGKRLGNRAIWTSGCRIQGVSKVVRPWKARRNSQPLEVSWRGMTKQYMWVLLGNFSKISQRNISVGRWPKESPNKPPFLCLPMSGFYWYVTKGRQITENPVPRRRPCQKRQLVDVIGDPRGWLLKTAYKKRHMESDNPHQPTPVSMSTKQESLNVLTAKVRSVRPWRSRFNLGSQGLTTFHMWWVSKVVWSRKRRRNSQPLEVSWRGMTKQYMWVLLGNFSKISQRNISVGRWPKESPNKPAFLCLPMNGFYFVCDQR